MRRRATRPPCRSTSRSLRRGAALLAVLGVMVVLTLLVLSFLQAMRVEVSIAKGEVDRIRARHLAESGLAYGIALLLDDTSNDDGPNDVWRDNEAELREVPVEEDGDFTLFYPEVLEESSGAEQRFGIWDETAKVNINFVPASILQELPGVDEALAQAIIDWRDGDDDPGENGAESDYYEMLDPPYACKNQPFETVEELLYVRGVDRAILYGEDQNFNGRLDAAEDDGTTTFPPDDADGVLDLGLAHFVTVYSYEPNKTAGGKDRVNINSAGEKELREALGDALSNAQIQDILDTRRQLRRFNSVVGLIDVASVKEEGFRRVVDRVTVQDRDVLPGRINVNTAPRRVLDMLPGVDQELARKIVEHRSTTEEPLRDISWLLEVLSKDQLDLIANFITVRSYQFLIQSVGRVRGKPVFVRIQAVVDRASTPYRVLYRRDISSWGWPYPEVTASVDDAAGS